MKIFQLSQCGNYWQEFTPPLDITMYKHVILYGKDSKGIFKPNGIGVYGIYNDKNIYGVKVGDIVRLNNHENKIKEYTVVNVDDIGVCVGSSFNLPMWDMVWSSFNNRLMRD